MTQILPPCVTCIYFHADDRTGNFCDAFPDGDGIPQPILDNKNLHREPYPGDHGIQYSPLPGWRDFAEAREEERE